MHPYATDSNERRLVPLILAITSLLLAWILNRSLVGLNLTFPWWIDAPSVLGFYGLFYVLFDKHVWQLSLLQRIRLIRVPNLNGDWKGFIASSFDTHSTKHDARVNIRQSWTRIQITLETQNSRSNSLTASVITEDQKAIAISFEYVNEPKYDSEAGMQPHKGTSQLVLKPESATLEGQYYTGRGRQNFGVLSLARI